MPCTDGEDDKSRTDISRHRLEQRSSSSSKGFGGEIRVVAVDPTYHTTFSLKITHNSRTNAEKDSDELPRVHSIVASPMTPPTATAKVRKDSTTKHISWWCREGKCFQVKGLEKGAPLSSVFYRCCWDALASAPNSAMIVIIEVAGKHFTPR